jgi:hypothetical protein
LTKTTIFLYEDEMLAMLPAALFELGISRGKAIIRSNNQKLRPMDKPYYTSRKGDINGG